MGGFISAALAQLDSMFKEHKSEKLWRHSGVPCKWMRFRDDGRGIIGRHLEELDIKKYEDMLNIIYGNNLRVFIEDWSYKEVVFLDARIIINSVIKLIEVRTYNKNIDLRKEIIEDKFSIIRFPEPNCGWTNSIYRGCMVGALKRVLWTCNTTEGCILGMLELLWEWVVKGYKLRDIEGAIRQANIIYDDLLILTLRDMRYPPKFSDECQLTTTITTKPSS